MQIKNKNKFIQSTLSQGSRVRGFIRAVAVLALCFAFPTVVWGQWSSFLNLTTDDGLSHSNVKAIERDGLGFLWIGTKNGLNRFDGKSLRNFNVVDSLSGHADNNVGTLYDDGRNLWIGTDNGVFRFDRRLERFRFIDLTAQDGTKMDNWVAQIKGKESGNVWIVVSNRGVFTLKNDNLTRITLPKAGSKEVSPSCMEIGPDGTVWIGSWGGGLMYRKQGEKQFRRIDTEKSGLDLASLDINALTETGGILYLGTQDGRLYGVDIKTHETKPVEFGNRGGNVIRTLASDGQHLYVGTYEGMYVIDGEGKLLGHARHDAIDGNTIGDDIIYTLNSDSEGNLWIGTLFGGMSYQPHGSIDFKKNRTAKGFGAAVQSDRIRGLDVDAQGNIWVGTEGAGLSRIAQDGSIRKFGKENLTTFRITHFGDTTYVCTYSDGLLAISKDGATRHYSAEEMGTEDSNVFAFHKDRQGNFWLGNGKGAWKSSGLTMKFGKADGLSGIWIHDIKEDKEGNLWFATNGSGIRRMDRDGKIHIYNSDDPHSGLKSNSVTAVFIDSKDRKWFSTDHGGLALYNKETDDFTSFAKEQGLPDDVVYDIQEDGEGRLWFGTDNGLVCFNPETKFSQTFNKAHGLRGNQFNYSSAAKGRSGNLYFGSQSGMVSFSPVLSKDTVTPRIYFSRLTVDGTEVSPEDKDRILSESILSTDHLTIPEKKNNIQLELSMPTFWGGGSTTFEYRLEPLDKEWRRVNGNTLNFAELSAGKYALHVRGRTSDGKEAESVMYLKITPPWYASIWAKILYLLLFLGMVGIGVWYYHKRRERQFRHLQRMIDMENEKVVYESKLGFFTEVAHEIRTPVTLISAPLQTIKEMQLPDSDLTYNLGVIEANTDRLLTLISQMLDMEKVGREKYVLNCVCQPVNGILQETADRFRSSFERAGQSFSLTLPEKTLSANIDRDAMIKIISNLLNNALKYGERQTSIDLEGEDGCLMIRVCSRGDQIPAEMRGRIFHPFERGDAAESEKPGSGIGLGLAKALAELQRGDLYLDAEYQDGNAFVVTLPMCDAGQAVQPAATLASEVSEPQPQTEDSDNVSSVRLLIVEDNDEIREYLSGRLQVYYKTVSVANGVEALKKLKKGNVDLVITDVMMPEMNGLELCAAIKGDETLSHIPVIMLTAKNDTESKLSGLRCGAEAYVEKPFNFSVLKEQISTLVRNRQKEREAFSRSPFLSIPPSEEGSEADQEFTARFERIVNENLADEEFNVEKLADLLCLSRSALFRKIKQQFGMAPVALLRSMRLKKGAELIATGKYRIQEIGPMVGISSASYFNSQFQKQFGMTPKEYENQCRSHLKLSNNEE